MALTKYAATIPCLRCGRPFDSPDRINVRFDDSCRRIVNHLVEQVACEEALHA